MITDFLLTEKYRPVSVDDFICDEGTKNTILGILKDPSALPHLLMASSVPGTGKTSLAKLIVKNLNADCLYLNASDERGIDVVRGKIMEFAKTVSFNPDSPKIVHLDEADGLTRDAQQILRNVMEEYAFNCRFILTCNNYNKIIEPIRSRCKELQFTNPPKDIIAKRLLQICEVENIKLDKKTINKIIEAYYPDIRSMVKTLDSYLRFGVLDLETQNDVANQVYELIKQKKLTAARQLWLSKHVDYSSILKLIYRKIWDDTDIQKQSIEKLVEEIAEANFRMVYGADQEIQFARCMFRIMGYV